MDKTPQIASILLVDDNSTDALLTREAFKLSHFICDIKHTFDGLEALEYLHSLDKKASNIGPDLILMDLNMPRMDGRELLAIIKNDGRWQHIPVVVLSNSESKVDMSRVYGLHANCYVTKPIDFADLVKILNEICRFWFTVATLPGRPCEAT